MQRVQTFLLAIIAGALVVPAVVNYQKQRAEEIRLDQAYEKCTYEFVSQTNKRMREATREGERIFRENYIKEHGEEPPPHPKHAPPLYTDLTIEDCLKSTLPIKP